VGGLIHLLLPESSALNEELYPARYASTGLPLFISELCRAGAVHKRLQACVAGGALVGRLSSLDLNLDIGGRNTEKVETILKAHGIPVAQSETGGFFTCRLSLDLTNWKTEIVPLTDVLGEAETAAVSTWQEDSLARQELQPIPQLALRVIRMLNDSEYNYEEVARVIRQDQTLSAKVLNMANSSFFRGFDPVDSIDRALAVLGERNLLQLAVSAAVERFFPQNSRGYSMCKGGLYRHSVGTAQAAGELARVTGLVREDLAYTAGLLHDVGKVGLDQYLAQAPQFFYRRTQLEGESLLQAEKAKFGINHAELGGRLARAWELPASLVTAITHHHFPEEAGEHQELTHLVYWADLLMSRFRVGLELEHMDTSKTGQRLKRIGFTTGQLQKLVDLLPQEQLLLD
jgi:putative nucleotidyltransferase with HDIG domain